MGTGSQQFFSVGGHSRTCRISHGGSVAPMGWSCAGPPDGGFWTLISAFPRNSADFRGKPLWRAGAPHGFLEWSHDFISVIFGFLENFGIGIEKIHTKNKKYRDFRFRNNLFISKKKSA